MKKEAPETRTGLGFGEKDRVRIWRKKLRSPVPENIAKGRLVAPIARKRAAKGGWVAPLPVKRERPVKRKGPVEGEKSP